MRGYQSVHDGAAAIAQLALEDARATGTGGYFVDGHRVPPSREAQDAALARTLYLATARFVGVEGIAP